MTRVKRGTTSNKTRRNVLKHVKGYRNARSTKERQAREAIAHAGVHAFNHRRDKKGGFRRLWQVRISSALKKHELSYSTFINMLKKKDIGLNRKMLSDMVQEAPDTFDRVVAEVK